MRLSRHSLRHDRRAVSALEFAIIAPIIAAGFLAAADLGSMAEQTIWLTQAARAGGQYAITVPNASADAIAAAVQAALPDWEVTVTVQDVPCAVTRCVGIDVTLPFPSHAWFLPPLLTLEAYHVAPALVP